MTLSHDAATAFNTANAAFREGRYAPAKQAIERAIELAPEYANAYVLMARILRQMNEHQSALDAYLSAVAIEPDHFDALLEGGNVLRAIGDVEAAEKNYRAAFLARPADARPALALAMLYESMPGPANAEKAAVAFHKGLDRASKAPDPNQAMAKACRDLARQRLVRSDLARALEMLRCARLLAAGTSLGPHIDLDIAETFLRLGMMDEAEGVMQTLSAVNDADFLKSLAHLSYRFNYWAEAVAILKRATELAPQDPQRYLDLADMQVKSWQLEDALVSLQHAEDIGAIPTAILAALRASIANRLGDSQTALSLYDQLVSEGQETFASSAAMSLLYSDQHEPTEVAARHRALFEGWGETARPKTSFKRRGKRARALRVGMVTGDFHHQHPVNIFMQPVLERWNNDSLPLTIYFTGNTVDDQTRLARSRALNWRDVTSSDLPSRVEADQIDILIDLAGHTSGGTLRQFAKRMAPVQISFLGYPGSTGVPNIDWLIGDPVVTPPEADDLCSERVVRLPHSVFCFAPQIDYPLPDFAAAAAQRPITFGSFNNIPKLTPRTIRLWANVLKAVPGAQLLLRAPSFKDSAAIDRFRRLFEEHGIERSRLLFRGPVGLDVMMQSYSDIDIALDPVPYCGGTTTLQAMWMGVPVLTLKGGHFVARMGASFMSAAGLSDWVAEDDDAYVRLAQEFASNRAQLTKLKRRLRSALLKRPAWDIDLYARDFEDALRSVWLKT